MSERILNPESLPIHSPILSRNVMLARCHITAWILEDKLVRRMAKNHPSPLLSG
jgi:hypothetical protein